MQKVKYIIVGQGIAGTVLATLMHKNNISFKIIDNPSLSSSSKVAAGLINPIVFKRLTKSWMADELIPFMEKFYEYSQDLLSVKFYHKKNILKVFVQEQEIDLWKKKSNLSEAYYLNKNLIKSSYDNVIENTLGFGEVLHSGYLNMPLFLEKFYDFFITQDCLIREVFDYSKIEFNSDGVKYKDVGANKIIFCEGYRVIQNPYFNFLPLKLTKGEVITIYCKELDESEKIINKGVFILPLGNHIFKVGATYDWDNINEDITLKGKEELLLKLKKVLRVNFEVVDHLAGIRPTVVHRRPLLGAHPNNGNMFVFNGMGTKGVMLAPYFAQQLINFLEFGIELNKEVDIKYLYL